MLTAKKRDALLELSTSLISDAMVRLNLPERVIDPTIRPVIPFSIIVGTAVTVLLKSQNDHGKADLSIYQEAFMTGCEVSFPVMVVEVPELHHHQGIFGEGAAKTGCRHEFVGALIDGAVRDTQDLKKMNFPVFSRSIAPGFIVGKVDAISSGEPVCIGGVIIKAGEIIFCDNDGVIVIEPVHLGSVIKKAKAIKHWEHDFHSLITAGWSHSDIEKEVGSIP
ncbi:MAG: hypothetical protein KAQ69_07890 [Spirochaetales bacterium]|nr:hypothetical protein [Spirochaetales bacterium]